MSSLQNTSDTQPTIRAALQNCQTRTDASCWTTKTNSVWQLLKRWRPQRPVEYVTVITAATVRQPYDTSKKRSELGENETWLWDASGPLPAPLAAPSSTLQAPFGQELPAELERVFAEGREELFEDGVTSEFSRRLTNLITRHGEIAIDILIDLIVTEKVNSETAAEALRWVGRLDDPRTRSSRLWLLEKALFSPSSRVRDGAALGLASMDDAHAAKYVVEAIRHERIAELRQDLEQVLEQLTFQAKP